MIINVNKICNRINYNLERISCAEYLNQIKFGNNYYEKNIILSIDLKEERFGFDPEVTAKIAKKCIKIKILLSSETDCHQEIRIDR